MIKIKLSDKTDIKCFGVLLHVKEMLKDYSIDITNSNDYDYEFVSAKEFVNLSLPLKQSIDWGLENLSKKSGDYFLFHGADSTSILGAYEVFKDSKAKYMFKKQLLSQEDYKKPSILNKWFFGTGSKLDLGYDIPDNIYSKIKLMGYNVGHNWPHLQQMQSGNDLSARNIDVCAIYQGILDNGNMDHEIRSDILYTKHRKTSWDVLEEIENSFVIAKGQTNPDQFIETMKKSKIGISPFGMGELCYRDLELVQWGCLLIKPDMERVITEPDFFKSMETYVPIKPDWSDLNKTIERVLTNYDDYLPIIENARKKIVEMYSYEKVCLYWYNFFANQGNIETE